MAINSPNGKEKADLAVLEILKNGPPDVPGGLYKRRFVCFSCWFSQGRSGNMYLIKHKNLRDGRDETFSQILRRVILPLPRKSSPPRQRRSKCRTRRNRQTEKCGPQRGRHKKKLNLHHARACTIGLMVSARVAVRESRRSKRWASAGQRTSSSRTDESS